MQSRKIDSLDYYQIRNIKLYVNQNDQINKYKEIQIDYFKDIVLILLGDIFDSMHENSDYALNKITKNENANMVITINNPIPKYSLPYLVMDSLNDFLFYQLLIEEHDIFFKFNLA